jgi:hypothetical protein
MTTGTNGTYQWLSGTEHELGDLLRACPATVVFVNYQGFALAAPETEALTKIFWKQMEWIGPLAYIADETCLNFATSDRKLFTAVWTALRTDEPPKQP